MTSAAAKQRPFQLFYVYTHKDERLRDRLEIALTLLKRQGLIREWHDRKISPGQEWEEEINKQLEIADIILLLISPDFIASDYCYGIEMKRALARHGDGSARVVPILVRTVPESWQTTDVGKLQALPKDGKAVDRWIRKDAAWANIEEGIRRILQDFQQSPPKHGPISPRYALLHEDSSQKVTRSFLPFNQELLIGRDDRADIRLPEDDKKASRRHCHIRWSSDGVAVFDLDSKNGTFLNEKRVDQMAILYVGDRVRCGRTVFSLEDYSATESEDTANS